VRFRLAAALVCALAALAIASTWRQLSHTPDEPVHLAAGMEWLQQGSWELHPENPPVARVAVALLPHLAGLRLPAEGPIHQRGLDVLYDGGDYARNLALSRAGALPFFLLAALVVWRWALSLGGPRAALLAVLAFCTLPPVLAHAGLATTDMAFAATFALALWSLWRWLEAPSTLRSLGAGAGLGLALATKFSTLVFFPPCALVLLGAHLLVRRPREQPAAWVRAALAGLAVCGLVVWGCYRFSFGAPSAGAGGEVAVQRGLPSFLADVLLPAPEAARGVAMLRSHVRTGHDAYLLERVSADGFAAFYPVAVAVKTPLAFLILGFAGAAGLLLAALRREPPGWPALAPAAAAAAILAVAIFSTINIGLRHVLAVYPVLAVSLGVGVDDLFERSEGGARRLLATGVALLFGSQLLVATVVRPDYLGWFNALAGREPGRVLVDSDLDWGQDVLQLERFCAAEQVPLLNVALFGNARLCEHRLPELRWLPPGEPVTGWVAVSEMYYRDRWRRSYADPCERRRAVRYEQPGGYAWLNEIEPVARVGSSIRIYLLPAE
jgi:4-amino-4-deoxy-L-arabinose transferase-like glycosyltransferase